MNENTMVKQRQPQKRVKYFSACVGGSKERYGVRALCSLLAHLAEPSTHAHLGDRTIHRAQARCLGKTNRLAN